MTVVIFVACSKSSEDENRVQNPLEKPDTNTLPSSVTIADNTKLLSSKQIEYIQSISADNSSITFSQTTPQEILPVKGDIILQFTPTEQFQYGFLGRVEDISHDSNGITIITSDVTLDEAFDYFVLEQPLNIADRSRLTWGKDEYGQSYISQNINSSFQVRDNISINICGNIMYQSNIVLRVNIDKNKGKNEFAMAVKNRTMANNVGINITGKSNIVPEKCQVKIGNGIPINFSNIGIQLVVQPYLGLELEGQIALGYNVSFENSSSFTINHKGEWSTQSELTEENHSSETEVDHSVNFSLNGSTTISLIPAMEFKLFGRDNLKIAIEPKANYSLEGEVDIDFSKPDFDDTTLYDTMKDSHLNCGATIGIEAKIDCGFFKNDRFNPTITMPIAEWKLWEHQKYIFPSFENGNINQDDDKTSTSIDLGRDLLFTSEVGIAQYINNKPIYSDSVVYKNSKDFDGQNPLITFFSTHNSATYYTYTKWGNKVVKCKPIASIVGIWECVHAKGTEIGYDGWEHNCDVDGKRFIFNTDGSGFKELYYETTLSKVYSLTYEFKEDILQIHLYGFDPLDGSPDFTYNVLELTNNSLKIHRETESIQEWLTFKRITQTN